MAGRGEHGQAITAGDGLLQEQKKIGLNPVFFCYGFNTQKLRSMKCRKTAMR